MFSGGGLVAKDGWLHVLRVCSRVTSLLSHLFRLSYLVCRSDSFINRYTIHTLHNSGTKDVPRAKVKGPSFINNSEQHFT